MYETEPFPFVVWRVFMIDVSATLSGSGNGEFFATMLRDNGLPQTNQHLLAMELARSSNLHHGDARVIQPILEVDREISIHVAHLAHLGREMREVVVQRRFGDQSQTASLDNRFLHCKQQIEKMQEQFRRTWNSTVPAQFLSGFEHNHMPERIRGIFEKVSQPPWLLLNDTYRISRLRNHTLSLFASSTLHHTVKRLLANQKISHTHYIACASYTLILACGLPSGLKLILSTAMKLHDMHRKSSRLLVTLYIVGSSSIDLLSFLCLLPALSQTP